MKLSLGRLWIALLILSPISQGKTMKAKRLRIDKETVLRYQTAGSGPPLVFVPGWTFSSDVFTKQIQYFSEHYRVYALDPRGQGGSSKSKNGHNYLQHGRDLKKFFRKLKIKQPILVSWSYGCLTAYAFARLFPKEKLRAFVCIDQTPRPFAQSKEDWSEGLFEEHREFYQALAYRRKPSTQEFCQWMLKESSKKEVNWCVNLSLKTPTSIAIQLNTDGIFSDYGLEAKRLLSKNALLVTREEDQQKAKRWLSQQKISPTHVSFGGHMMFWENAERFNQVLLQFLKKH